MRLSFSSFFFSVIVAAAAAGPWKAFSLDAKNGEIPSSSRRSLQKSSKKTGPVRSARRLRTLILCSTSSVSPDYESFPFFLI